MSTPTINVNLRPCDCDTRGEPSYATPHDRQCDTLPVPIPCPIPRSVMFEVRLGECICTVPSWWTATVTTHAELESKHGRTWTATSGCACGPCAAARRNGWLPGQHNASCPARPIRVACDIDGMTWADTQVGKIEARGVESVEDGRRLVTLVEARWALLKALVLGQDPFQDFTMETEALVTQRDAVFAALAEMARAEEAAVQAQQRVDVAFPYSRFAAPDDNDHRKERPSVGRLAAYVKFLLEGVGRHE